LNLKLYRVRGGKHGKKAHLFKKIGDKQISLCGVEFDNSRLVTPWQTDQCCKTCKLVSVTYGEFVSPNPVYSKRVLLA